MRQAIALWLIILFAEIADGVMEAFDTVGFMIVGAVVMAVSYILVRGDIDASQPD